jgi:hypothetical protein
VAVFHTVSSPFAITTAAEVFVAQSVPDGLPFDDVSIRTLTVEPTVTVPVSHFTAVTVIADEA